MLIPWSQPGVGGVKSSQVNKVQHLLLNHLFTNAKNIHDLLNKGATHGLLYCEVRPPVVVDALVTHAHTDHHALAVFKEKETVTKRHGQGCCRRWTSKVHFILTELRAVAVSAGSTPEPLAFVTSWKGNGVGMLRRKTSIVKISGQSPFPRGNY